MPVRITTVDVEIMNTAAILIAYTFTIMYEAARAKRKVAELVSSCGAEMVATKTTAPITAAAANSIARNNKALPKKTVAKKRSSRCPSRSRSTPINHRKATPANGTRFNAIVIALVSVPSQAPGSSGSAGIEVRISHRIDSRSSEKAIPAMAAAFGVFR
jgi:hypothetical protein